MTKDKYDQQPTHPPPWQVRWKRPRLDHVELGIEADDEDGELQQSNHEEFEASIRDDWVPISSSSVVLTRDEARRAILELYKRDRLLLKKRKQTQQDFAKDETQQPDKGTITPPKPKKDDPEENTPRNSNVKKTPAPSPAALLSPSSWFKKSQTDSTSNAQPSTTPKSKASNTSNSKPPRSRKNTDSNLLSPPSSNLFTTFSNVSSTSHDDEPPSPPLITDASTASSLLWEDNTLTSVSEEDAAAFRMYESSKLRRGSEDDVVEHEPLSVKDDEKQGYKETHHGGDDFGGGLYYRDRHGNIRSRHFDGFDNVVLAVTIYATTSCQPNAKEVIDSIQNTRRPNSGEVVVIELLSTRNPPNLDSSTTVRPKQSKVSASSSSQTTSPHPMIGGESDSSAVSSASTSRRQDNEEDESISNHARILARRVLRWPSAILPLDSKTRDRPTVYNGTLYSNVYGCPSLVSIGRKSLWEERKKAGSQHAANLKPKTERPIDENSNGVNSGTQSNCNVSREDRIDDALDAIRSLNFLFGEDNSDNRPLSTETNPPSKVDTPKDMAAVEEDSTPTNTTASKRIRITQPLCLCFITNDGRVLFFHAMKVFLNKTNNMTNRSVLTSFATLFWGEELLNKVCDDVIPLSQPDKILELSQVASSIKAVEEERGKDFTSWNTILSSYRTADAERRIGLEENEDQHKAGNWSRLIDFDASIEPKSLKYRTLPQSNTITCSVITSNTDNALLAVCGKGIHRSVSRNLGHPRFTLGGFVTFVSLRHCNEARTIYLPFAVGHVQSVFWNNAHYVILLGEKGTISANRSGGQQVHVDERMPSAVAFRVDSKLQGGLDQYSFVHGSNASPDRFQPIVINLPSISDSLGLLSRDFFDEGDTRAYDAIRQKALSVSCIPSAPPGIVMSFHSTLSNASPSALVNISLSEFRAGVFLTTICPGHRHRILNTGIRKQILDDLWCTGGQGWSLVGYGGNNITLHYISWEGTTEHGPFVLELNGICSRTIEANNNAHSDQCLISCVIQNMSVITNAERASQSSTMPESPAKSTILPFTSNYHLSSFLPTDQGGRFPEDNLRKSSCSLGLRDSIISTARNEGGIDDVLVSALGSISVTPDRSKALTMSHEQKSKRILQHCSSWTQLDDTRANRGLVHGQVMSTILRLGSQILTLTLRTNVVINPISTPFNQVLSWLCQRQDYFTAAGVALSLLDDIESVYELRGIPKETSGESIVHQGLLDGITPLIRGDTKDDSHTLTSLADMTVGCLIKGGVSMASTLEGFLSRNKLYDSARASLMLVGTIALVLSSEMAQDTQLSYGKSNIVERLSKAESPSERVLWPIKCLLKMAVARNCLSSTLLLLNSTIPNELRWRIPQVRGLNAQRPSLGLFLAVVELILESTSEATRSLLDLYDEESGLTYWFSVGDDTRLALCLFSVHGKHVMIQQPEVRCWILERLKGAIESSTDRTYYDSYLPDEWLCEVISGVFCNAESDICLGLDAFRKSTAEPSPVCVEEDSECYRQDMLSIQNLLNPKDESGGIDFDILIPSLLLLSMKDREWREGSSISTQILLNTVCDMAGRKTSCVPRFIFDGQTAVRLCGVADNVQAAAFLVGGRSGLVLECADLIITKVGLQMKDAEIALFGSLVELKDMMKTWGRRNLETKTHTEWTPSNCHRHVLWLIQHHVLNVATYGDFDLPSVGHTSSSGQGKLTPVVAGRICFRAWLCLTANADKSAATEWLEVWLRRKLELHNGTSPKRLACAALVRVLLWADEECSTLDIRDIDEEVELILGTVIGFDVTFLAELSHACVGLIQSIPPQLQAEVVNGLAPNTNTIFSFEVDEHQDILSKVADFEVGSS